MRKRDELTNPDSCLSRARDQEMMFVLLGRDAAVPVAIRAWIAERVRLGKNGPGDAQLTEAEECARAMEAERMAVERPKFDPVVAAYKFADDSRRDADRD